MNALKWLLDDLESEARVAGGTAELYRLGDNYLKMDEKIADIYEGFAKRLKTMLAAYYKRARQS